MSLPTQPPTKYPTTATPIPTTNMSKPDRKTPRPVYIDLAPQNKKCESIDTPKEMTIAVAPCHKRNGDNGITASNAVASTVTHPYFSGDILNSPITPATSPKFAVSPSLNPYTTLRRNPPDAVLCHGSAPLPAIPPSVVA